MSDAAVPTPKPANSNELRTRVAVGLALIVLVAGVLLLDQYLQHALTVRWYPFLLVFTLLLTIGSCFELHALMDALPRPPLWLALLGCGIVVLSNWPAHLGWGSRDPWRDVACAFGGVVLAGFLYEIVVFREPGHAVTRCALLVWMVGYLGILSSFFTQLRWWPIAEGGGMDLRGETAIALTIFVAKGADIGAFFTGKLLGRHRMSPTISPKKTLEGLAGGIFLSIIIAVILNRSFEPVLGSDVGAAVFGVVVGLAGVMGDLAESLIKRDAHRKDASHVVPGFGGLLDVVDSVLFAAPVAYWWMMCW